MRHTLTISGQPTPKVAVTFENGQEKRGGLAGYSIPVRCTCDWTHDAVISEVSEAAKTDAIARMTALHGH